MQHPFRLASKLYHIVFRTCLSLTVGTGLLLSGIATATTQTVITDGTTGTIVNGTDAFIITGGTQQLETLFHSFENFSPGSATVLFQLDPSQSTVDFVIGRITGNHDSQINGQLSLTGGNSPDLLLINPNGISFGANAELILPASFLVTTAESILFTEGKAFTTNRSDSAPLLTVSTPIGLRLNDVAAPIRHQGGTLSVAQQRTLAFLGGNLQLSDSELVAEQGRIELGSVETAEIVGITPVGTGWTFDYSDVSQFQDIEINQGSVVSTRGAGGGDMQLQGRRIVLTGGSQLRTDTTGAFNGGMLRLSGSAAVELNEGSSIEAEVESGATGNGSNVVITAPSLVITEASAIGMNNRGAGIGGDLQIQAQSIEISGDGTEVELDARDSGQGGNAFLETDRLLIGNGGRLQMDVRGAGDGGTLEIQAQSIEISNDADLRARVRSSGSGQGANVFITAQTISLLNDGDLSLNTEGAGDAGSLVLVADSVVLAGESTSIESEVQEFASGRGGSLNLTVNSLQILDGAELAIETEGIGDSGELILTAHQVIVDGVDAGGDRSQIEAAVDFGASGNGGDVTMNVQQLHVLNGGLVTAATNGDGNAGNLLINAGLINVQGQFADGQFVSTLATASNTDFAAGSVQINADRLNVQDSGVISASGRAAGDAGGLEIAANTLYVDNGGRLQAEAQAGNQGNITIAADLLMLRKGSQITTTATGSATGGNIAITAPVIVGLENSDIVANAISGDGGNINITAQGILGLAFRESLTPESDITASSEFGVSGTVELDTPQADQISDVIALSTTILNPDQQIVRSCTESSSNHFIASGRGGIPISPREAITGTSPWRDMRHLPMHTHQESTRQLSSISQESINTEAPPKEATNWSRTINGDIQLINSGSIRSHTAACLEAGA